MDCHQFLPVTGNMQRYLHGNNCSGCGIDCQADTTVSSCTSQATIDARFAAWLAGVTNKWRLWFITEGNTAQVLH